MFIFDVACFNCDMSYGINNGTVIIISSDDDFENDYFDLKASSVILYSYIALSSCTYMGINEKRMSELWNKSSKDRNKDVSH